MSLLWLMHFALGDKMESIPLVLFCAGFSLDNDVCSHTNWVFWCMYCFCASAKYYVIFAGAFACVLHVWVCCLCFCGSTTEGMNSFFHPQCPTETKYMKSNTVLHKQRCSCVQYTQETACSSLLQGHFPAVNHEQYQKWAVNLCVAVNGGARITHIRCPWAALCIP